MTEKFLPAQRTKGATRRCVPVYFLTLVIAAFAVACTGSATGETAAASSEDAVATQTASEVSDELDESAPAVNDSEDAGRSNEPAASLEVGQLPDRASAAGARAAFLDCLTERGVAPGDAGPQGSPVDEETASVRESCAAEAGLDSAFAEGRAGGGGFGGGGAFRGGEILSCLGDQGLEIEGIESLADLGLGFGGEGGFGTNAGDGFDAAAAALALAEQLGLDPEDPSLAAALETCLAELGGAGRFGDGPNAVGESLIEAVALCLGIQDREVDRDRSDEADGQSGGLIAIAEQLGLDLTDPDTLPAVQACLLDPSGSGADDEPESG